MEKRIVKVKTKDGFECDIDLNVVEDYRFLKIIRQSTTDGTKYIDMVETLLGIEGEKRLIEHILDQDKNPSVDAVGEYIEEILLATKETKN